jgi:predicted NUDIX family NTP pyrophosphohydrolase
MKTSAGILLFRNADKKISFFLVHPGGPFWKNKDLGAWSIPKGEFNVEEDALQAAIREFEEETGIRCEGNFLALTPLKQKSGKLIYAWALEKDIDPRKIKSNSFEMEWPPRSGLKKTFPEIDRGEWFNAAEAKLKINNSQAQLIDELMEKLKG